MSHTPEPWIWETTAAPGVKVLHNQTEPDIVLQTDIPPKRDDARLIAAAPELLEACKKFVTWLNAGQPSSTKNVLYDAEAAIAKATLTTPDS